MTETLTDLTPTEAAKLIRQALRQRTGRAWSVRVGRGSVWGWLYINASPARQDVYGAMSEIDRVTLRNLLGIENWKAHEQGVMVESHPRNYREYVNRARTGRP